ncbi:MAG: WecB/TagA/CpsF family glycosyltransferase [Candidatus Roizmanbacteria bacterium]
MLGIQMDRVLSQHAAIDAVREALSRRSFLHVVSLNPENVMSAQTDDKFKEILNSANIQIIDGIGVLLASRWTDEYKTDYERVTGVDLLAKLVDNLTENNLLSPLVIGFIGGKTGVATRLADQCRKKYPSSLQVEFVDIPDIDPNDSKIIRQIVDLKINLLFVALGSPNQEKWIQDHRSELSHIVCMGVGGAFDMLTGLTPRAPKFVQNIGFEWLYRLITQPWRWGRQVRIIRFAIKVLFAKGN